MQPLLSPGLYLGASQRHAREAPELTPEMGEYEQRATKLDLLDFLDRKEVVNIYDLVWEFNYTYKGAWDALARLRKQRLVARIATGSCTLTDLGRDRLLYLKKKGAAEVVT